MQIEPLMLAALATVAGACVGSYCNVVAWRERGSRDWSERIAQLGGRSKCPACGQVLAWWALVPVASWVAMRGRCASCGVRISPVYPAVEAIMGAGSGVLALLLGFSWWLAPALLVLWCMAPPLSRWLFRIHARTRTRPASE